MKLHHLSLLALGACLSLAAWAETKPPQLYVNENLGFNVEGYDYAQSEYPCDLDKILVNNIVERASASGFHTEAAGTADKLHSSGAPVLAIDIDALVLGSEEFTFGTRSHSHLPSVRVTVALIKDDIPDGFTTARHSCSIATLNELSPSSNILDLGAYGTTVCSATRRCLGRLSKDIVQWVTPQL